MLIISLLITLAAATKSDRRLLTFGLVADSHYDTFPAGEKAPWQPLGHWFHEQRKRTTTTSKRRYDLSLDKMEETVMVFNRLFDTDGGSSNGKKSELNASINPFNDKGHRPRFDFACNLGDLVNNDLMWNLKPILDAFADIKAPHYHLVGNHDYRAHNDRFGKLNLTQHAWLQEKMVGLDSEWYFKVDYLPFRLLFINSMIMEPEGPDPEKRRVHLAWLKDVLTDARALRIPVLLFAHIPIGITTNVMGPTLRLFDDIVVAAFFGHDHKGGYIQQGSIHSVTINGQIETLTNAFAIVEVFEDRLELTGFGRVPTRVLPIVSPIVRQWLREYDGPLWHPIKYGPHQSLPKDRIWLDPKTNSGEALQVPPPLSLNIPNYKKPLLPFVSPNPGSTDFLANVYSAWPRLVRSSPASEMPVDLNSANEGSPVFLINNSHVNQLPSSALPASHRAPRPSQPEVTSALTMLHRPLQRLPTDSGLELPSDATDPLVFALAGASVLTVIFGIMVVVARCKRLRSCGRRAALGSM